MSRSFVKEQDGSIEKLPDLPLSEHTNYVTPRGLAQLRERLVDTRVRRDVLAASSDAMAQQSNLAALEQELRWLTARVGSAVLVNPAQQPRDRVAFGAHVTVDGVEGMHNWHIVGEDEADVAHSRVSYVSPLARALLGARVGDEVSWQRPAGDLIVEIVAIDYDDAT